MNELQQMAQYLETVHITRLMTAARMAGLRFKNGDPGFNKAGIIEKLTFSPSILRATIATLHRMESGENVPPSKPTSNPFADDIAEEQNQTSTPPAPILQSPSNPALDETVQRVLRAIGEISGRLSTVEREKRNSAQVSESILRVAEPMRAVIGELTDAVTAIKKEMIEQKPINIVIGDKPVIEIGSGQHKLFPRLIQYLQVNRRLILTGSAGTGKSMAVFNAAQKLGVEFYLQPPVTMAHELIGHRDAAGVFHETPLFKAYTKGGLILMDESDASLPDALLVANPIFDGNGFAMFGDGKLHRQHPDFLAVMNMNTTGHGATMQYAGRNRLDGATLARFCLSIHWTIDDSIEARMACGFDAWLRAVRSVRAFMEARQIQDVNATPRHVKTGAALLQQCPDITRETILEDILKNGAVSEVWNDVLRLPEVSKFLRG